MIRWRGVVLGALTFLGAHAVLVAAWSSWFEPGGAHTAWFLNSGRAVGFTIACLVAGSALAAALGPPDQRERLATGASFAGGSLAAMIAVLFAGGAGTIFPIVIVFAAAIALASGLAGAFAAGAFRTSPLGR
jgi:hypothetical protein